MEITVPDLITLGLQDLVPLCRIVYDQPRSSYRKARQRNFFKIRHFGNGGPHILVCEDRHRLIVVIRGTEPTDPKDIIADGRALATRSPIAGKVHRGIQAYADEAMELLSADEDWFESLLKTKKQIWICGHSLGGGVANHFAITIGRERIKRHLSKPAVLTIGAPPVGTLQFCQAVVDATNGIYRLVNYRDPIPLLVPRYTHPDGVFLRFDQHGEAQLDPTIPERIWDRASGSLRSAVASVFIGAWAGLRHWSVWAGVTAAIIHVMPFRYHSSDQYVALMEILAIEYGEKAA